MASSQQKLAANGAWAVKAEPSFRSLTRRPKRMETSWGTPSTSRRKTWGDQFRSNCRLGLSSTRMDDISTIKAGFQRRFVEDTGGSKLVCLTTRFMKQRRFVMN